MRTSLARHPLIRAITADKYVDSRLLNSIGIQVARQVVARVLLRARYAARRARRRESGVDALLTDGLLVIPNFLPKEDFERLRAECVAALDDPSVSKADLLHGPTIVRRIYIKDYRERLPLADAVSSSSRLMEILSAAEGKDLRPERQHRVIERVFHGNPAEHDPENDLHIDTFHSTHKVWLYLDDVASENGPLAVVPRSHQIDPVLLRHGYRYFRDITDLPKSGSRRIDATEVSERGLKEVAMTVPANTLVVANTGGYHRRLRGADGSIRTAIHVSVRTQPFLHWIDAGTKSDY